MTLHVEIFADMRRGANRRRDRLLNSFSPRSQHLVATIRALVRGVRPVIRLNLAHLQRPPAAQVLFISFNRKHLASPRPSILAQLL